MGIVKVERLDHLGIVTGVIQDLGIIEMIDSRIIPDEREEISTGEAVAGMILNSLGFTNRPISLTPQFFESKAMGFLFWEGISSDSFNRFNPRVRGDWTRCFPMGAICCSARLLCLCVSRKG